MNPWEVCKVHLWEKSQHSLSYSFVHLPNKHVCQAQGYTKHSDMVPIFRELKIQGVCEMGGGMHKKKPTESL